MSFVLPLPESPAGYLSLSDNIFFRAEQGQFARIGGQGFLFFFPTMRGMRILRLSRIDPSLTRNEGRFSPAAWKGTGGFSLLFFRPPPPGRRAFRVFPSLPLFFFSRRETVSFLCFSFFFFPCPPFRVACGRPFRFAFFDEAGWFFFPRTRRQAPLFPFAEDRTLFYSS